MNISVYIYIYHGHYNSLFYNETLNRMDVVPDRAPHDFYRRSRCKRKRNVALVKPLLSPPSSYTAPEFNTHEYIYRWMYSTCTQECLSAKEMELS